MKLSILSSAFAGLVLASAMAQAGPVQVVYVHPEQYTDVRDWNREPDENLQALSDYFQSLGQTYLPADQRLQIEVLDVDLAGKLRTSSRWGMVRVVGKPLDWPQIKLRYRLESSGGKLLASGEESVSDMAYASHLGSFSGWQPLSQEKHMLKTWFRDRLAQQPVQ